MSIKNRSNKPLILANKGFLALNITQFFGAFNDNAFKILVTLMLANMVIQPELGSRYISIASALFVIPFLLFSTYAGHIADRFSKRDVAVAAKFAEIGITVLGFGALFTKNIPFMIGVLCLMGAQSAFFGPAKYGILPEMLEEKDLSNGNGIIQLSTFAAIILGTITGGVLIQHTAPREYISSAVFVLVAVLGTISSLFITRVPASGSTEKFDWNPLRKFYLNMKEVKKDRVLFMSMLGIGYFWLVGAIFQIDLLVYGKNIMNISETAISTLLAILAVGIGLGSMCAGKISAEKIELGLVPLGSIGLGIFALDLAFAYDSIIRVGVDLFCVGFFAGFFIIPLNAIVQSRSAKDSKGKMVATANVISFIGVLGASFVTWFLTDKLGVDAAKTLSIVAVATFAATAYIIFLLPEAFLRLVLWFITHTIYRIKVVDRKNFPLEGPVLLVSNHLSYVDPFLVAASVARPIRFFMWRVIYDWKPLNWFFKLMKAIPIASNDGPKKFMASMEEARQALRNGEAVCIFAEGGISRYGQMLGFRRGLEAIAKDMDVPILPVNLDRIWGSIFSFDYGKFVWKIPRRIPYPVTVSFGEALPSNSTASRVRQAVLDLSSNAFEHRQESMLALHRTFLRQSKKQWFIKRVFDSGGMKLSYGEMITASVYMAGGFSKIFKKDESVGILLPPCVPAVIVNLALLFAGKIPVNLNYTMKRDTIDYIMKDSSSKKIITSRKVVEHLKWEKTDNMVFVEDIPRPNFAVSLFMFAMLYITPAILVELLLLGKSRKKLDDIATLIYTSGSTGTPKGVMLTHRNIHSNIQGLLEVLQASGKDSLIGVLPFFHSFGYTGTIWFPLLGGFKVAYHRSPMEAVTIQKLIKQHKGSILLATPTFLKLWAEKFNKEDIGSVKFAIVGAEKLRDSIAEDFIEKFDIPVLEGYGCSELSPVACVSVLNKTGLGVKQIGSKLGKVGRPLPGVSVKVVDPQTLELLPPDNPGLLLVRGTNVMKGYWNNPAKTAEVIKEGWYLTGDIAMIDEDGFIQITDRLSRFSKIAGEMAPHILVEDALYKSAGDMNAQFAVTGLPDEHKGEKLVVLYTGAVEAAELVKKMNELEIPKLWIPSADNFYKIEAIPLLGTGKVDLASVKKMAGELNGGKGLTK